ncbi:MAG TPA: hypothetical protein DIT28_05445 [Oxalobacteraceae bacterium]|nr:hypothetical protein [Oxalobacteraceae bacterium]
MLQRENNETIEPLDLAALPDLPAFYPTDKLIEEPRPSRAKGVTRQAADAEPPVTAPDDGETGDDTCPWTQSCPGWTGPVLKMIEWQAAEAACAARIASQTGDERKTNAAMAAFRARGDYRKLQPIPTAWRSQLATMERMFPNFTEVIDYLRVMYALAERCDSVPRLTPILLNGAPGSGKSYFSEHFAKQVGAGYVCTHLETAQSNAGLSGSADYWSNSRPGEVFKLLVENDFANPVILLDEVDKVSAGDYDPMASLYGLLEPGTARGFRDLSYPWLPPLDASRITWIATANDARSLPAPIRDRFRCFDIATPTAQQARSLIKQIFVEMAAELPPSVASMRLAADTVEALITCSPRRVKQQLREGLGRAIYHKRKRVLPRDVVVDPVDCVEARTIGFL